MDSHGGIIGLWFDVVWLSFLKSPADCQYNKDGFVFGVRVETPNARAKRRGGKASPRSQNVTPRPLERWVGRPGKKKKPGLHGFCSLLPPFGAIRGVPLLRLTALPQFFHANLCGDYLSSLTTPMPSRIAR